MRPGKGHGPLHIGDAGAPRDERGAAIDIAVPNTPGALVSGMIIRDQLAAQGASKSRDLLVVESGACAIRGRQSRHMVTRGWERLSVCPSCSSVLSGIVGTRFPHSAAPRGFEWNP